VRRPAKWNSPSGASFKEVVFSEIKEDEMIMERKTFVLLFFWTWVFVCAVLVGRPASAADVQKIGYVDLRVALNESETGKKAKGELEAIVRSKQSSIEEKGKSIEKLKAELEKQGSVLSAEARKAKEEEIERQMRDYQRLLQDSQNEIKKKEEKLTGTILRELRGIIVRIGEEEGYSLILENFEGLILFASKDMDITSKVVKRYNEMQSKQKK
jgi:outer membrane protein